MDSRQSKPPEACLEIPNDRDNSALLQDQKLKIFFWNLDSLPRWTQFIVCVVGVFQFYLLYGYLQELIFRLDGFKKHGWYLTLIQFGFYSFFGFSEIKLTRQGTRRIPFQTYFLISLLTVATMGLSNSSLGYLNYPTQVIFKCCKLIPVMIGGVLIQGKKYGGIDVIACISMSVGLIWFILADSQVSPNFDTTGVVLISLALCADAAIGNVQERAMRQHEATNTEVVFYSYSIGFVYIALGLLLTGQLSEAFFFCAKHPIKTYGYAWFFSLSGYLGLTFVLTLIRAFGALPAVTVTTCRKAFSIILSFVLFTKPFTMQYIWSGLVVLFGISLNVYQKNKGKLNSIDVKMVLKLLSLHLNRREKTATQIV